MNNDDTYYEKYINRSFFKEVKQMLEQQNSKSDGSVAFKNIYIQKGIVDIIPLG